MFLDRSTLYDELEGLVGAHQTYNPQYPTIINSLLASSSGKYWNDEHPLLKDAEAIDQAITNFSHFNYTAYAGGTTYSLYDKVVYSGVNYEYINATPSAGNTPPNATYWKVIDSYNDYLLRIDRKASDITIDSVMNSKKIKGQVGSIFNNVQLFRGQANRSNLVTNAGKMVGLILELKDHRSLVSILHKVGHQFNEAVTFDLYLYHTSQVAPLATFEIAHSTALQSQWTALTANNILRYISDSYDVGGQFLLGYFQDDLDTAKAMYKDIVWSQYKSCCGDVKEDYRKYSPFMGVSGFSIDSDFLDGTNMPDPEKIVIDPYNNYGLNLQFTTKCDLTPFLIEQKDVLAEVKSLNMAYLILQDIANSTRGANAKANQVSALAKSQIYTHKDAWGTVLDRLNKATQGLEFDLSGLNQACLPCDDMVVDYSSH